MKPIQIRKTVSTIASRNGFGYYTSRNELVGDNPVSIRFDRIIKTDEEEYLVFIIGVNPKLPAEKRRELWITEGLRFVSLCEKSLDVDRDMYDTNQDGRTFAVKVW
jgi:hypothetical protein